MKSACIFLFVVVVTPMKVLTADRPSLSSSHDRSNLSNSHDRHSLNNSHPAPSKPKSISIAKVKEHDSVRNRVDHGEGKHLKLNASSSPQIVPKNLARSGPAAKPVKVQLND